MDLIAKANQAILQARCLRREGRSLRFEATVLASQLDQTVRRAPTALRSGTDPRGEQIGLSCD